jgi:hypothetical protein
MERLPMDVPFFGGCACGAVRYECSAVPVAMVNCTAATANAPEAQGSHPQLLCLPDRSGCSEASRSNTRSKPTADTPLTEHFVANAERRYLRRPLHVETSSESGQVALMIRAGSSRSLKSGLRARSLGIIWEPTCHTFCVVGSVQRMHNFTLERDIQRLSG